MMRKTIVIIFLFFINVLNAQTSSSSKAQGSFLSFGVGPRLPVFDFFKNTDIGYGFNIEFSYSDTDILPLFFYGVMGFDQFPGSQNFFQESDYSNFHTNALAVDIGVRHYFPPLLENIVLFMPFIQGGVSYSLFQKLHEFKVDRGRNNFLEENSKFGLNIGAGFSMFMMEVLGSYHFFKSNNFISMDLKVRIPIFVSF
jgi:opacity protein-like surface antigen